MLLILQNRSSVSVPPDTASVAGAGPELPGVPYRWPGLRTPGASARGRCGTRTGSGAGRLSPAFPAVNSPSEPPGPRAGRSGAGCGARSGTGLVRGRRAEPALCCSAPLPQSHRRSQNQECKCIYRSVYMMGCLGLRGWGFFCFLNRA